MNKEQVMNAAEQVSTVMNTMALQNDYFNLIPSVDQLSKDELATYFMYINRTLDNIHELNQHLVKQLDEAASVLYDLSDEMEDTENESN